MVFGAYTSAYPAWLPPPGGGAGDGEASAAAFARALFEPAALPRAYMPQLAACAALTLAAAAAAALTGVRRAAEACRRKKRASLPTRLSAHAALLLVPAHAAAWVSCGAALLGYARRGAHQHAALLWLALAWIPLFLAGWAAACRAALAPADMRTAHVRDGSASSSGSGSRSARSIVMVADLARHGAGAGRRRRVCSKAAAARAACIAFPLLICAAVAAPATLAQRAYGRAYDAYAQAAGGGASASAGADANAALTPALALELWRQVTRAWWYADLAFVVWGAAGCVLLVLHACACAKALRHVQRAKDACLRLGSGSAPASARLPAYACDAMPPGRPGLDMLCAPPLPSPSASPVPSPRSFTPLRAVVFHYSPDPPSDPLSAPAALPSQVLSDARNRQLALRALQRQRRALLLRAALVGACILALTGAALAAAIQLYDRARVGAVDPFISTVFLVASWASSALCVLIAAEEALRRTPQPPRYPAEDARQTPRFRSWTTGRIFRRGGGHRSSRSLPLPDFTRRSRVHAAQPDCITTHKLSPACISRNDSLSSNEKSDVSLQVLQVLSPAAVATLPYSTTAGVQRASSLKSVRRARARSPTAGLSDYESDYPGAPAAAQRDSLEVDPAMRKHRSFYAAALAVECPMPAVIEQSNALALTRAVAPLSPLMRQALTLGSDRTEHWMHPSPSGGWRRPRTADAGRTHDRGADSGAADDARLHGKTQSTSSGGSSKTLRRRAVSSGSLYSKELRPASPVPATPKPTTPTISIRHAPSLRRGSGPLVVHIRTTTVDDAGAPHDPHNACA